MAPSSRAILARARAAPMTDLAVALVVAILVVAALHVPRWGDALGRRVRGDRARPDAPEDERDDGRRP